MVGDIEMIIHAVEENKVTNEALLDAFYYAVKSKHHHVVNYLADKIKPGFLNISMCYEVAVVFGNTLAL